MTSFLEQATLLLAMHCSFVHSRKSGRRGLLCDDNPSKVDDGTTQCEDVPSGGAAADPDVTASLVLRPGKERQVRASAGEKLRARQLQENL